MPVTHEAEGSNPFNVAKSTNAKCPQMRESSLSNSALDDFKLPDVPELRRCWMQMNAQADA